MGNLEKNLGNLKRCLKSFKIDWKVQFYGIIKEIKNLCKLL